MPDRTAPNLNSGRARLPSGWQILSRVWLVALLAVNLHLAPASATERRSIDVGGFQRGYRIFIPPGVEPFRLPVVIALHGAVQSAAEFAVDFGMNRVAAREQFAVVYPEGLNLSWDDARPPLMRLGYVVPTGDDVPFLGALVDRLVREGVADPSRIYLAGLSMGGFMTVRMACERPDLFAAIAIMAATVPARYRNGCRSPHVMPALVMHGTHDLISSWNGLPVPGAQLLSAMESAQYYADLAGCMIHADSFLPGRSADGTTVRVRRWSICRDSAAVMLYAIEGGGHMPPSHQPGRGETFVSIFLPHRSHVIDAAEEIWRFFAPLRRHDSFQRGISVQ